jgi:hypothetical protein
MEEVWKSVPVDFYNGYYEVSNLGNVRSVDRLVKCENGVRSIKGTIKKLQVREGYPMVSFSRSQIMKSFNVHRLVAIAFIPNPKNYPIVNHIDGNKWNNSVSNLEWCDYFHNNQHSVRTGLNPAVGERQWNSTIPSAVVKLLREEYSSGKRVCQLVKEYSIRHSTIWSIVHHVSRKHDGI